MPGTFPQTSQISPQTPSITASKATRKMASQVIITLASRQAFWRFFSSSAVNTGK